MKFDTICNSILERAFHGTPHDVIGSFSLNKIGSGEGSQVYGWGLYFAENSEVAKKYQKNLSHKDFIDKVSKAYDEYYSPEESVEALENAGLSTNQMTLVNALREEDWWGFDYPHQAVRAALREPQNFEYGEEVEKALANFGNLYQVEINADKENDFLDWDLDISKQNEIVKNIVDKIKNEDPRTTSTYKELLKIHGEEIANKYLPEIKKRFENILRRSNDGKNFYTDFARALNNSPKNASEYLNKHGIKGIKYLDQGSRGVGEGTYNYVIFDPSIIQIVSKNGEFVMSSKKPENVEI
jgi:hypothetical protein